MKKTILLLLILALAATSAPAREAAKVKAAVPAKPAKPVAAKPVPKPEPPQPPYKAFIVVEAQTGQVLEGENVHQPLGPASITKLMLGAVVVDRLNKGQVKLDDKVTASMEASSMGGSQVYLKQGEVFSLDEMMRAVMVASANDAAFAVAEHIGGNRDAFVELMNEKAKSFNMNDSMFSSPHGLPPSAGYEPDLASCHDLALLARELVKHPQILAWTSIKTEPFREGTLIMRNHNHLMDRFAGMDGLKTGFYREAGFSIVTTAKRNNLRLICVVMGSPSAKIRDSIAEEKLKKHFALVQQTVVVKKGDLIDKDVALPDCKQKALKPVAATEFSYPVPRDKKQLLTKDINLPNEVSGEIKEGQRLGELVIRYNKEEIGKVDLISPVSIPKAGFFYRLFH